MQEESKSVFNPSSTYEWEENSNFPLTGVEFGMIHKNLSDFIGGTLSPVNILKIVDAYAIMQNKLKQAVESGVATEKVLQMGREEDKYDKQAHVDSK